MVNAVANSSAAPQSQPAAASPLPFFVNNATDANGAPVFAQAVREALNKTTSNSSERQLANSDSTVNDGAAPERSKTASPSPSGADATPRKPTVKRQSGNSATPATNPTTIWPNALYVPLSIISASTASSPPLGDLRPVLELNPRALPPEQGSHAEQQNAASESSALPASSETNSSMCTNPATVSSSFVQDTLAADASLSSLFNGDQQKARAAGPMLPAVTDLTAQFSDAKDAVLSASPTTAPPGVLTSANSDNSAKNGVGTPILANLPDDSPQGQSLESVVHQLQDLLSSGAAGRNPISAVIDLTRTATQSTATETQHPTSLVPAAENIPAITNLAAVSEAKGASVLHASQQTHAASSAQNETAQQNGHSSTQDSSTGSSEQDTSNASTFADPGPSPSQAVKSAPASFSDALRANPLAQPGAGQTAQLANTGASQLVAPVNSADTPAPAHSPTDSTPSGASQATPALFPSHIPDSSPGRFVNDAQLTNATSQSEMRIAMQTDKLGAIELHARISGDELGAAIIVEKRDAHAALAVELPALQQALSEKQLRVEQVALTQGSLHSSAGDAGPNANAQNGQRGSADAPRSNPVWNEVQSLQQAAWYVPEQGGIFDSQGRLSVQA
jgi:Flagellar hook-length control protein FliK